MSKKRETNKKPDNSPATRGRPPRPLPRKTVGTPYTPQEVARIITTTKPNQIKNRD